MPAPCLALRRAVPGGFMPIEGVATRCALYGLDPTVDLDPISWLARDGGRSIFDVVYNDIVQNVIDNVIEDFIGQLEFAGTRMLALFMLAVLINQSEIKKNKNASRLLAARADRMCHTAAIISQISQGQSAKHYLLMARSAKLDA